MRPTLLLRPAAALTALAAALCLAACASSPKLPQDAGDGGAVAPSSAPSKPAAIDISKLDACTLLPKNEAEALVGATMLDPMKAANSDVTSCTYPPNPSGTVAQVEIYVGDGAKQQLDIDKDKLQHAFTQPSGLGDEAWQEDDMIWARTGTTWVSIRIVRLEDPSQYAVPLQTAMKAVLGRL